MSTDIAYAPRAYKQTKQHGSQKISNRPLYKKLKMFSTMYKQDATIQSAIRILVNSVISTIGPVIHEDEEIATFCNNTIQNAEDLSSSSWYENLAEIYRSSLVSGFSVAEPLFIVNEGQMVFNNFLVYDPLEIDIRPDDRGNLSETGSTLTGLSTGIFQTGVGLSDLGEKRLPLWKIIHLTNNSDYGNYYGSSLLEPLYKWYALKERVVQVMIDALDVYGNPLLYITTQNMPTNENYTDPSNGEQKVKYVIDAIEEQIMSMRESGQNVLVLPEVNGSKPTLGTLAANPNIGRIFLDTLQHIDEELVRGIIPYFLLGNELRENKSAERRMEVYYNTVETSRSALIKRIIQKVLKPLIEWNFNRESAKIPPSFARIYSDRPEDRVATMQAISGLTDRGYMNPNNASDFLTVRQMVRANTRDITDQDESFIKEIWAAKKGSGRPTGTSKPQNKARPKTEQKPKGDTGVTQK